MYYFDWSNPTKRWIYITNSQKSCDYHVGLRTFLNLWKCAHLNLELSKTFFLLNIQTWRFLGQDSTPGDVGDVIAGATDATQHRLRNRSQTVGLRWNNLILASGLQDWVIKEELSDGPKQSLTHFVSKKKRKRN